MVFQTAMKLLSLVAVLSEASALISPARSENFENNEGCILRIEGILEYDDLLLNPRHDLRENVARTMSLSPSCAINSDIVNIEIPSEGIKRSFQRVDSSTNYDYYQHNLRGENKELLGYWSGSDPLDGSSMNYIQNRGGEVEKVSLIDMITHGVFEYINEVALEQGSQKFDNLFHSERRRIDIQR
mmetsp:Transcript_23432/g.34850  ORF Transcript_23432/g.34850 Transcript_23432/m.34850 type:complete len:185 (+) Transcript_23432:30-584(+)